MNVSVGKYWEEFIAGVVDSGRYGSASEVVRAGLRILHAEEEKVRPLKDTIRASLARGGQNSPEDLDQAITEWEEEARAEGY